MHWLRSAGAPLCQSKQKRHAVCDDILSSSLATDRVEFLCSRHDEVRSYGRSFGLGGLQTEHYMGKASDAYEHTYGARVPQGVASAERVVWTEV